MIRPLLTEPEAEDVIAALGIIERSTFAHRLPHVPHVRAMLQQHLGMRPARPTWDARIPHVMDEDTEVRR